jgi:putative redox protein
MDEWITVNGLRLAAHVARPPGGAPVPAVVLCHGFPSGPRGAASSASTFPELADRIAREIGWHAVAFNLRGTGTSEGDFSPSGWLDDLGAVIDLTHERDDVRDLWLVGVAEGGTFAMCAAARNDRVRGLATLAAPASLREWGRDPTRVVEHARRVGMIRSDDFPSSANAFGRELSAVDAQAVGARLTGRPVLILHGADDAIVTTDDARSLQAAVGRDAELRIVPGAGHELRHDPRAIAVLLGWLDRLH